MRKAGSCTKKAVLLRGCFFISFLYFHDVDFGSVIFEDANEVFCVQPDGGCVIIGMNTYLMAQKCLIEVEVNRVFFVIQVDKNYHTRSAPYKMQLKLVRPYI